jgi:AraC-like DNA-binding protein/catechol 2,3-dioxygenase-like lactoylglutathione lyase family enzyme
MDEDLCQRLTQARSLLIQSYDENLRLEEIASTCFLSPFHFHRLYRSKFGETPLETLTHQRMESAKRQLRETKASIGTICHSIGYASQSTFSLLFRRATGLSPVAYRELCRSTQERIQVPQLEKRILESAMKFNLSHTTVFVKDQDSALDFYTKKLEFEVSSDVTLPEGFRWLTVAPPGQMEIVLFPIGAKSGMKDEVTSAFHSILETGHLGTLVLQVADCEATYQELLARGVEFDSKPHEESYGIQAVFRDDSGNRIAMIEDPSMKG